MAGIDAINTRSARILEKLGFRRMAAREGSFGPMWLMSLEPAETGAEEVLG